MSDNNFIHLMIVTESGGHRIVTSTVVLRRQTAGR